MDALKIFIIIILTFILLFPMLPFAAKANKVSTIHALRYREPHNRKNGWFLIVAILECILMIGLVGLITGIVRFVLGIPFVGDLISSVVNSTSANIDFITFVFLALLINILTVYTYAFLKKITRSWFLDRAYGLTGLDKKSKKKKKKSKKQEETTEEPQTEEPIEEKRVVVRSEQQEENKDKKEKEEKEEVLDIEKIPAKKFWGLFFHEPELRYAKPWILRVAKVLQFFIYFVEILYTILFVVLLYSVFFPASKEMYAFLIDGIHIQESYMYPFISLIFLQEFCNVFNTKSKVPDVTKEIKEEKKVQEEKEIDDNIRALHLELQRRFDDEHNIRYYPEAGKDAAEEYVCSNRLYASSLDYIQEKMKEKSNRIVRSYMECLDAAYNNNHVYFCASFYSEIGEYLIRYTYTRLLSGSRMIFILSDRSRMVALRKYIGDALMELTGATEGCTWRVYTSDERLDQADVLIATPSDFRDDNIVENYPSFFEEVCNAVFIDADRIVELESYLCLVMANRLQKATSDRIRFIFLSQAMLRGFASSSLPKFFCVEEVLSFSSANENEAVAVTLWNKESKRNVVYNKHGQTLTSLEAIIAEQAVSYGVDGVRVITPSPLDRAEKDVLAEHNIEINQFYKTTPNINYMIYSDDKCNLAAALYTSTRFRGTRKSLVHIISHPYLLREYFMDRMLSEEYINRSSYIQPRVTEHAERSKLSLLRIFCDATASNGIGVLEFEDRMKTVISVAEKRGDSPLCPYCAKGVKLGEYSELNVESLAAYLLAALCDKYDTPITKSIAKRVKDYYLIVDSNEQDGFTMERDKRIVFKKVKEIFDCVLKCNERVKLCINDEVIGELDTFPSRVDNEYVVGQSIMFNNTEYEIGHISEDRKIIFLRRENVTFKNCLDTIFLRRYKIGEERIIGEDGVFNKTHGLLEEIRVSMRSVDFRGETYGFYSLLSNCQTLDFVKGAVGNPHLSQNIIDANARNVKNGKLLRVTLSTRMECNDNMRLLLGAVFNEFIRTIFPKAYRQIAICPVLENPIEFNSQKEPSNYIERVRALYPYIADQSEKEENKKNMQFLFINDCQEDVGALDWFYDRFGHYMHEFLANIYSYLNWLRLRPTLKHYIYFGADTLPECYDVDNCCELLKDYNIILSEGGVQDYETAGNILDKEEIKYCSFCGKVLESGRYIKLDDGRYVCVECDKTSVREEKELEKAEENARKYLSEKYPEIMFGLSEVKFFDGKFNKEDFTLSNIAYRLDIDNRTIYVQKETPEKSIERSIVRAVIELWQHDNELLISCAKAQVEYEEILLLKHYGFNDKAKDVEDKLEDYILADVQAIKDYLEESQDKCANSFTFMRYRYAEVASITNIEDPSTIDEPVGLYDPNKIPRFWKRYLRGESVNEGEDKLSVDERVEEDIPDNLEDENDNLEENDVNEDSQEEQE